MENKYSNSKKYLLNSQDILLLNRKTGASISMRKLCMFGIARYCMFRRCQIEIFCKCPWVVFLGSVKWVQKWVNKFASWKLSITTFSTWFPGEEIFRKWTVSSLGNQVEKLVFYMVCGTRAFLRILRISRIIFSQNSFLKKNIWMGK